MLKTPVRNIVQVKQVHWSQVLMYKGYYYLGSGALEQKLEQLLKHTFCLQIIVSCFYLVSQLN